MVSIKFKRPSNFFQFFKEINTRIGAEWKIFSDENR